LDDAVDLEPSLGALVVTFLLVTPLAGTLLGFNWTQAVSVDSRAPRPSGRCS
jgi:hypothetical protein